MLALQHGKIIYRQRTIVCPDIALQPNEIVGLVGASGVGKSSVAQLLAGLLAPFEGEPTGYQGKLTRPAIIHGQANPVQWVIQQPEYAFNPKLTLQQSLQEAWRGEGYLALLDDFDIQRQWLTRKPSQLSGGQLQRLNLVRALLPSTQYLLCDEITASLDMITQQQVWQSLLALVAARQAQGQPLGLLVISHDLPLLTKVCQRLIDWESL